ncbi:MAG TPA: hypothetical protein VF834_14865 [Streptosporangiaceae bacterium]
MSAGWVAGSVRARAIARRRLGAQEARRLAACGSLADALAMLAATPYRVGSDLGAGQDALAAAQHAVAASVLWDLRVLAGWLPQGGTSLMRAVAGWFEIANVAERIQELAGRPPGETFRLGALATAWPQLRSTTTLAQLRAALAASAWKDPGGDTAVAVEVGLRARWAQRAADLGDPARTWAAGALAILLAGERFGAGQRPEHPVLRSVSVTMLGRGIADARGLEEFAARLPRKLAELLDGIRSPDELWRAEAAWWARTEQEGYALLADPGFDRRPVIGAAAVLAADARRVRAALEVAARGGGAMGAFDAVA